MKLKVRVKILVPATEKQGTDTTLRGIVFIINTEACDSGEIIGRFVRNRNPKLGRFLGTRKRGGPVLPRRQNARGPPTFHF